MTTHTVCAVWDNAAQAFAAPFTVPSSNVAVRSFAREVNREADTNNIYHHAADYELWMLGTYNDEEGAFTNHKERLCRAIDYKENTK